jgi:hypothetical protein
MHAPYDDVAAFTAACFESLPKPLGMGLKALTTVFGAAGILYGGRFFFRNDASARARQWREWRNHRLAPCRDFVRFYESLAVLALYSRPGAAGGAS